MTLFGQGHALAVGVGDYKEPVLKAPITVSDAEGVAVALADPAVGAYHPEHVRLLHNDRATRADLIAALEGLAERASSADTVFVFFCGHGILGEDGLYYFTTQDTVLTASNLVKAGTGLSGPEILGLLRAIPAQKLLFVINACFSGHVSPALSPAEPRLGSPPSAALGVEVLATGEGRALITASRPTQYSYYRKDQSNTYFGRALIDGLRGKGVPNSGGYIGLYELYQHVYRKVHESSAGEQEPVLTILQGVGPFPIALYAGSSPDSLGPAPIQQTPPYGTAVEILDRAVVEAVKTGGKAMNITAKRDVAVDQSTRLIDFGRGTKIGGNVSIGDVAGENITKITTTAAAAGRREDQELMASIDRIRAELAGLIDAPKGKRQDADDELRKAQEASRVADRPRMLEKLEGAQRILLSIGSSLPAALKTAETISVLVRRETESGS
jgi:hypothetical protein